MKLREFIHKYGCERGEKRFLIIADNWPILEEVFARMLPFNSSDVEWLVMALGRCKVAGTMMPPMERSLFADDLIETASQAAPNWRWKVDDEFDLRLVYETTENGDYGTVLYSDYLTAEELWTLIVALAVRAGVELTLE